VRPLTVNILPAIRISIDLRAGACIPLSGVSIGGQQVTGHHGWHKYPRGIDEIAEWTSILIGQIEPRQPVGKLSDPIVKGLIDTADIRQGFLRMDGLMVDAICCREP
jgi:hypothetical protein